MRYIIPHRWNQEPCWEGEIDDQGNAKNLGAAVITAKNSGANMDGADLCGANLRGADLGSANLGSADLRGANLCGANLGSANLGSANLRGANLRGADLGSANLGSADLRGANLCGANLGSADLRGANLCGADLRGANLGSAKLVGGEKLLANGIRMIGPIGSRSSYCTAYATDKGLRFRAGCFFGDAERFRSKIVATHGVNDHALDYEAWIAWCEAWYARMIRLPS